MNYVLNDKGETVIASGAPGSIARAKCERPALIEQLNAMRELEEIEGKLGGVDSGALLATHLHSHGVLSPLESSSVLLSAGFSDDSIKEVWDQLLVIRQNEDMENLLRPAFPMPRTLQAQPGINR